jgi:hypothetical protein
MATPLVQDQDFRLGPANLWVYNKPRAELTTTLTGTNNDFTVRAQRPGILGNDITLALIDPGANSIPLSVEVVDGVNIVVTLETSGAGAILSTAAQVRDAINAHAGARSLVYAVLAAANDGTGVVTALAETPLAGGSEVLTERFLGALTEETVVRTSVAAAVMTAHVTGSQPRDKIVTGGTFQISAGLKELTLANFALGFPNASLIEGADGKRRLEFAVRTGESLRQARGVKMQLRRVLAADQETADPHEILTIPLCSPVDGEVELNYNIETQRNLPVIFECWPDARGLTAFFGYEDL